MKIEQFLEHHGIASNPFSEEDAQTDPVFKEHCIRHTRHPSWAKVFGDPTEPATSIVFGEKGSGKTALRLQIASHLDDYNRKHPQRRLFVIEYDDFNPFLDRFAASVGSRWRRPEQVLAQWKLWDHMDAILSLGVTQLVDRFLGTRRRATPGASGPAVTPEPPDPRRLTRSQSRDLLLLAACYDQSSAETYLGRWQALRAALKFPVWKSFWSLGLGVIVLLAVLAVILSQQAWTWLMTPWPYAIVLAGWLPWLIRTARRWIMAADIARQLKTLRRPVGPLARSLACFRDDELSGQPLPKKERTDDRFELLAKLQGILESVGYSGIVVLLDRVDEPHLINGSPERMKALLWPLLDNKFLKHPGVGLKLLLPVELSYFLDREERDFYQRARLDKQNLVPSLQWTGEALYDVANARLQACASNGAAPTLRDLFHESITDRRLIEALRGLRVPRHMFKFLYRLFMAHANAHTMAQPSWKISAETFESTLALYERDQDAADRGIGAR